MAKKPAAKKPAKKAAPKKAPKKAATPKKPAKRVARRSNTIKGDLRVEGTVIATDVVATGVSKK